MNFFERAEATARKGIPVIRLRPNSKAAMDSGWPQLATTDLETLKKWNAETPDANCGAVAGDAWLWETDSPDVAVRIKKETGHDITSEIQTYKVRSRVGRGHYYFKSNAASQALGNVAQTYVRGQDWSARVHNAYVVAANSLHPDTGEPYTALNPDAEIVEAPEWLISWIHSQRIQKHSAQNSASVEEPRNTNGRVAHGSIHNFLLRHAGRMRNIGLTQDEIETALLRVAEEECEPPIDQSRVRAMARSMMNYAPTPAGYALTAGLGPATLPPEVAAQFPPAQPPPPPESEVDASEIYEYPVFPRWVMHQTSLYEGFVKPYCEKNSRIPEFMWLPAVAMMLNYLGGKVHVPMKNWATSLYLVVIGEKGRANKSSSIASAKQFFEYASMLTHYDRAIKNAEGRSLVWEVGSPEGLGVDMTKTNCKNAILHYDELSGLVGKARIEGSGMNSALLKMYESQLFANSTKNKKDAYSLAPGTYTLTVITSTTDKKFAELWSQLAGEDTGLDDRFFFLMQPEVLPPRRLEDAVPFHEAALQTRKLIDKAVNQREYKIYDTTPLERILEVFGTRAEIRAEKFALYFAIDMGLDEIDEDCIERGIALVKYERAVKKYQMTFEAKNDEAQIQGSVVRLLRKNHGAMNTRDIEHNLRAEKYGTSLWGKAWEGMKRLGYIHETGRGVKGDPKITQLIRNMNFGEDE